MLRITLHPWRLQKFWGLDHPLEIVLSLFQFVIDGEISSCRILIYLTQVTELFLGQGYMTNSMWAIILTLQVIQVWNFLTLKNYTAKVLAFLFFLKKSPWDCRCKILINLVSNYIFYSDLHYRSLEYSALVVHLRNFHCIGNSAQGISIWSDAVGGNEKVQIQGTQFWFCEGWDGLRGKEKHGEWQKKGGGVVCDWGDFSHTSDFQ